MLETPAGFLSGERIAQCCRELSAVTGMSIGGGDYALSIGAQTLEDLTRDFLRNFLLMYANVGRLDPIAGVYMDIQDRDGVQQFAERAAALGFVGMSAVTPAQVDPINSMFTPSTEEVEQARHLIAQYDESDDDAIVVEGQLLEDPVIDRYHDLVTRYERLQG